MIFYLFIFSVILTLVELKKVYYLYRYLPGSYIFFYWWMNAQLYYLDFFFFCSNKMSIFIFLCGLKFCTILYRLAFWPRITPHFIINTFIVRARWCDLFRDNPADFDIFLLNLTSDLYWRSFCNSSNERFAGYLTPDFIESDGKLTLWKPANWQCTKSGRTNG